MCCVKADAGFGISQGLPFGGKNRDHAQAQFNILEEVQMAGDNGEIRERLDRLSAIARELGDSL